MRGEWDIRAACPNRVKYLQEAVDMVRHNYHDVDVVDGGTELGPCVYRTVFRVAATPEDGKAAALAIARINEFVRGVRAALEAYGWRVFEKVGYVDGGYAYMEVTWLRRIRLPFKDYATIMDIYELAAPYLGAGGQ
jgi:hypothetical protein